MTDPWKHERAILYLAAGSQISASSQPDAHLNGKLV